ncbi:hypothetical protein M441DRAFT_268186 [Trichoderma asperellum CBS 433.97]|uniref:Uncharacterized protein n=1 Tax=Trichoderma asperellum (strain ATCC 204424 / CBS 433.97 / NBRC 101777) TaxID=1042311 RepID=A0A2T3YVX2_TRIA4|nr:hypothetical protein M441DRAFT_268186 [Trichoderma asperellum CBS 433.97]PTB36702.1 hypothetical protein M441DRAFT_268186 [Trichoderma asperellum CBS 433.97]
MILNIGGNRCVGTRTRGNVCYFEDVIKDQNETARRLLLHAWWLLGSACATTYVADCFFFISPERASRFYSEGGFHA